MLSFAKKYIISTKYLPILFSLFCIGCSYFSPEYKKPELTIPSNWSAKPLNIEPISESLPYLAWWHKFNDPLLNQYIESGLKNNLNIQIAKANLEAAQGQLTTVQLNWLPFLNVFGGYVNGNSQNTFTPLGNLGLIGNTGTFLAVMPQYTINLFSNYTLQKQATYNLNAAKNAELSVRLAVIGQITAAYFGYLSELQLLEQFTDINNKFNEMVEIASNLNKQGLANEISVEELTSKQKLISAQIALARKNITLEQNALRYLINLTPGKIAADKSFNDINPNLIIPGVLPVTVLAARPDVLRAEEELKAANEGISISSSSLLPSVNLNYFYAQTNNQVNNNSATNLNSNQNYAAGFANWVISPSVFGQIDTSNAEFKAALANYKMVVNTALHEVDNALATNNGFNEQMLSALQALSQLESSVNLKQSMYNQGLNTYLTVLGAEIDLKLLEIEITRLKLQQLISLVRLYLSLGGGYQYSESALAGKIGS